MSLFIFTKQNNADFSCDITLKELAGRLKSLYRDVEIIDEVTIRIDCFSAELRHQAGTPYFIVQSAIAIPDNMLPSDGDLYNYCNEMNEQFQAKIFFHKYDNATALFFRYFVPNLNKMNIATINQIFIWLMSETERGWKEFEKRFHKDVSDNEKSAIESSNDHKN